MVRIIFLAVMIFNFVLFVGFTVYVEMAVLHSGKKSIAFVVCNDNKIEPNSWQEYQETFRKEIKNKRVTCNSTLKREYFGE